VWVTAELLFAAFYFVRHRSLQARPLVRRAPLTVEARAALTERCLLCFEEIEYDGEEAEGAGKVEAKAVLEVGEEGSVSAAIVDPPGATQTPSETSIDTLLEHMTVYTHGSTRTHTHIHARTHAHILTHTHTYAHPHIYTRICIRT
jgi:xanthine/CO dehydrogenase XdhC/CoxF family maturation factor